MPPSCSVGGMGLEPSLLKDIRPSGRPSEGFPRPFPAWGGVLSPEGPQLGGIGVVLRLSTSPTSAGYRDVVHTVHTRRPSTLPLCLRSRSGTLPHGASRNTPHRFSSKTPVPPSGGRAHANPRDTRFQGLKTAFSGDPHGTGSVYGWSGTRRTG